MGLYVDGVPQLVAGQLKEWADHSGVSPARVPGYWLHELGSSFAMGEKPQLAPEAPHKKEKVLLH